MGSGQNELESLEEEVGEEITKQELVDEMRKLHEKVDALFDILEEAHDYITDEPSKLDTVLQQNKEIANGIIALSQQVKEQTPRESSEDQPQPGPQRNTSQQQASAPPNPPGPDDQTTNQNNPPPPPGQGEETVPEPPKGVE